MKIISILITVFLVSLFLVNAHSNSNEEESPGCPMHKGSYNKMHDEMHEELGEEVHDEMHEMMHNEVSSKDYTWFSKVFKSFRGKFHYNKWGLKDEN